ncbi:MAG: NAD(P)H-binding protein, partial [Micromonosporaceae bacterium]
MLEAREHDVVPMSRSQGVDVITGNGLAAALAGVDCVIDAATGPSPAQEAATTFFTTAARNLHEAGQRAGVRRMIVVSIIGTDRFTAGYGAAKAARERAMLAGPDPGACAARRAVPRVRRAARELGHPGRGELRAEDAHPARRGQGRRRVLAGL